ncbi:MAG: hypothetical protein RI568_13135 [Natronomonas sp.]|uniref:hypothetical protein n=1 Tax=Natronomonas sp. TaxID=2184060 RepID=UPI0028701DD0|nr:hypothetical protein [Natronomonas sp.]MDR9431626.1 hypothetical protein [Natronomonas sp.]
MSTFGRMAYGFYTTIAVAIGGLFYNEVYVENLRAFAPENGPFAAPVEYLDIIVPVVLLTILLAVWVWVLVGSVQEERTVNRQRLRP